MLVKRHFWFFLFAALVLVSYAVTRDMKMQSASGNLPSVHFYDKSGRRVTLDDFAGKVVLVNLWATWCTPCIMELPSLDRLSREVPPEDFAVVAISMDTTSMENVEAFLKKNGIKNVAPYWDKDRQVPLKWTYPGLPTSFLLDRRGKVIKQYNGGLEWDKGAILDEMRAAILNKAS